MGNASALFNVAPGEVVEVGLVNPCAGEAAVQAKGFIMEAGTASGVEALNRNAILARGEAIFFRLFQEGAEARTKILARIRVVCSSGRNDPSQNARYANQEVSYVFVDILDGATGFTRQHPSILYEWDPYNN